MLLYIIRHGETDYNAKGVLQGHMDAPLNESGRSLAAIVGRAMKGIHFDRCISSPLKRASETAEIVLRESENDIPVETDRRIIEICIGDYEGHILSELGETGKIFYADPFRFPGFPGGERIQDVCERTQKFLRELVSQDDDKTYLIAMHGCALRAMLNPLYDHPEDFWHGRVPYNCTVSIVEAHNGNMKLIADDKLYYDPDMVIDRYELDSVK